jgi:hypothetical protein
MNKKVLLVIIIIMVVVLNFLFIRPTITGMFTQQSEPEYKTTTQNYLATPHLANPRNMYDEVMELKVIRVDTNE